MSTQVSVRVLRVLNILWLVCLAIFVASLAAEALFGVRVPRSLLIGPGVLALLPLVLVFTPGFSGAPYLAVAAVFSAAVEGLALVVQSLAAGRPFFGKVIVAGGAALALAGLCIWQGRLLWRGFRW